LDNTEYDFGFSLQEDIPLESVDDTRAQRMFDSIVPLLDQLLLDADTKPVINWPNRSEKILAFKQKLLGILMYNETLAK